MSGFNPYGNPQFPPQNQPLYPQLYNPSNAPPPGQPGQPGYPGAPQFPGYQQQPGMPSPYPGQPQNPASMSYPNVTPSAPAPAPGFGYPNATPQGYPNVTPQGYPNVTPQGYPNVTPQGYPNVTPSGFPNVTPTPVVAVEWIPSTLHSAVSLSDRAVVGGYEGHDGSPLWVIRSKYEGDLIPGKLAIKHHSAYVPWGGNENSVQNFEVCCARPETVHWVESRDGAVPLKAVPAGHTSSGETLYVGRARHQGSLTPGKVHPSHKAMYISFAGQEHPHKTYEVLCTV